ncbi:MAG TPA: PQQ-binding-like beta-propeller repeat protein [Blastocatellia bacterium]|nr:PQQ-binding-like beta-propeller repeat protein [Blastocatellia bacterium]
MRVRRNVIICAVLTVCIAIPCALAQSSKKPASKEMVNGKQSSDWPLYGRDIAGSHHNPYEKELTPATVSRLKPKWIFETGADVSSQPIVVDGVVYFGSWDGKEYAVDAKTGKKIWEFETGQPSRGGAAYAQGVLYFADVAARLFALDAKTGAQIWKTKTDPHPMTIGTSSPIYYNGRLYIGVSSREEVVMAGNPKYECCTFRGGVAAFDAKTGKEVWHFYTVTEEPKEQGVDKQGRKIFGPSGVGVWSTVSIHPAENRLYFTTGDAYTKPESKLTDSIAALELDTGKLVWSYQATQGDVWNMNCLQNPKECGPDHDFGTIPITFKGPAGKMLVGAGQKSGWFYAVDPKDGKPVWKTEVGPGGFLGGIEFGASTDGERIYVGISNHPKQGSVAALDGATGKILWQTMNPDNRSNFGPLTITGTGDNRLVFAGSSGNFIRAYDAKTGKILWEFDTGGAVGGGPTVVDGVLYVGSGYQLLRIGKANNKLYAFSLDGK